MFNILDFCFRLRIKIQYEEYIKIKESVARFLPPVFLAKLTHLYRPFDFVEIFESRGRLHLKKISDSDFVTLLND